MPLPRPRGMGLGADKVASLSAPSAVSKEEGEELKVIKGAFVHVISGSQRGQYGQVSLGLLQFCVSISNDKYILKAGCQKHKDCYKCKYMVFITACQ